MMAMRLPTKENSIAAREVLRTGTRNLMPPRQLELQKMGSETEILGEGTGEALVKPREPRSWGQSLPGCPPKARASFLEGEGLRGRGRVSAARGGPPAGLVSALPQCLTHSKESRGDLRVPSDRQRRRNRCTMVP